MSGSHKNLFEDLIKRVDETARSRFIASKRLETRDQKIGWIIAMASSYTIILTVMPYFIKLPADITDILNFYTIGLSIVILVSSLLVASRRDTVKAEQHHRSALELNELKREILVANSLLPAGATPPKNDMERFNGW